MDRERAEAHLRMLAEDEVRRGTLPAGPGVRVSRVVQALTAVGALDDETAGRIMDEVEMARALRHPDPVIRRHLALDARGRNRDGFSDGRRAPRLGSRR